MTSGVKASPPPLVHSFNHKRRYAIDGNSRSCSSNCSFVIQEATGPSNRLKYQWSSFRTASRNCQDQSSDRPALEMQTNIDVDRLADDDKRESHKSRFCQ